MSKRKSTAKAILSNLHALKERRYVGDLDASDILIDFERACQTAKLTKRQSEAIELVYNGKLAHHVAALRMGITKRAITYLLANATTALDEIYEYWAWLDGELTVNDFVEVV